MRVPTRHPRLSAVACKVYSLTIWVYPTEFRRAFGHELALAFRNRVEDVLDDGGILDWLAFAGHIALDWIHTSSTLITESEAPCSESLLGLSDGDPAHSCIARTSVDVSLVFVAGGVVLTWAVWYLFLALLISFVR